MGLVAVMRIGFPRRFVVRTTIATLAMVATVLSAVFVGVAFSVRERVRAVVMERLDAGQRTLSELEQRRARELSVQVATLAENPTLKQAVATYSLELRSTGSRYRAGMVMAIERELATLAHPHVARRPRRHRRLGHDHRRRRAPPATPGRARRACRRSRANPDRPT